MPVVPHDQLELQRGKEALRHGIVITVAFPAHARQHAVRCELGAVRVRGVLGGFNRLSQHRVVQQNLDGR